jgi:hypothetical protein
LECACFGHQVMSSLRLFDIAFNRPCTMFVGTQRLLYTGVPVLTMLLLSCLHSFLHAGA